MRRVIAIVVVLALIAGGAYYFLHDSSAADEIYYDDYIESPDAVSAEGSLEIVTLSGATYIHAVDVGAGSVRFSDGSVETHSVKKAQLDVYLLIGQSNAEYRFHGNIQQSIKTVPGTAYFYGTNEPVSASTYGDDAKNLSSMKSMNGPDGSQLIGNVEAPLASVLHELTGNKIMIINGAVGGVSVKSYAPGAINYLRASEVFNDGMDSIDRDLYDVSVRSYIWIQGESDQNLSVEQYKGFFILMHQDLTGNTGSFSEYVFDAGFISLVKASISTAAQLQLATDPGGNIIIGADAATSFTIENGGLLSDGLHYTQIGDNLIGEQLGNSIFGYYTEE